MKNFSKQGKSVASCKKISFDTALLLWKAADIPEGLPQHIVLGWDTVKVRPYVRRPTCCYHCQKYGNVASVCQHKTPVCGRCAADGHSKDDCEAKDIKCAACHQCHETSSPDCTVWKLECDVSRVKQHGHLCFAEALQHVKKAAEDIPQPQPRDTPLPADSDSKEEDVEVDKENEEEDAKDEAKDDKLLLPRNRSPWINCKHGFSLN